MASNKTDPQSGKEKEKKEKAYPPGFENSLNIICKSVVIQGLATEPQWSADGFFYQGTFSPLLTQQIGGEGTLEKLKRHKKAM